MDKPKPTPEPLSLLEIQRAFETKFGVHTLTGEYELIYCLLDEEWATPLHLQQRSRLSGTAFYYTLAGMISRGVLVTRSHPRDRRSKLYGLSEPMHKLVLGQHAGYMELARPVLSDEPNAATALSMGKSYIYRGSQVSHLTAEFQILLYLYLAAVLSNVEMSRFIDVSPSGFNVSLRRLRSLDMVTTVVNPADRRGRLYALTGEVRAELNQLHRRVFAWLGNHTVNS
ncbi:MarR family winged helix-turn-helix transcriptional regulator [Novosphingobium album (ex Hu et al. 2023)]|uniref:MarR family winged helix-turn-helix transcriptional regulator n=1 Tax=Novosphingobium album (ex Hu et al. 2023) TaxID=2930093 RepID=A0ABT0B198_9SPHN|nr:MarR family winged helix-turn-helix transcriptional regulator [Novosphingobium album (ex Hu et al. 2023)]MCJ2178832.1 MarR family winged helix-turn-helix transcriptional regulator [Novosphingobium album (ex Hu et al. 2023)]